MAEKKIRLEGGSLRMQLQCLIAIVLLTFSSTTFLQAQKPDLKFKRFSIDEGLSQGNINVIIQDRNGFIWLGTQDGLNRFDGYDFQIYKPDKSNPHSLSHGIVKSLLEGKDGTIWVGTAGGGLNKYNPKTGKFTSYLHDESDLSSISNNAVYALYEDKDSVLWVGTFGGGLCKFNKETQTFTTFKNKATDRYSLSGNAIRSIFEDREGQLWIGVDGGGMNKVDRSSKNLRFIRYQHDPNDSESLGSDIVLTVLEDNQGFFWIGSWAGGISKFNPRTGKAKVYKHDPKNSNSISSDETFSFCEDKEGNLWVSTRRGLDLFNKEDETFYHYKNDPLVPSTISHDVVIYLFEDKAGVLWIGTEGGGVNLVDLKKKKFKHYRNDYKNENSLIHNEVSAIYKDSRGYFWLGTSAGGVDRFNESTGIFEHFRNNPSNYNSISNNFVQAITEDTNGDMWFGTNGGGLNRYNVKTGQFTRFYQDLNDKNALQNNAVTSLIADRYGNIWMGTYGGGIEKYIVQENRFVAYTIDAENQMMNVALKVFEDADGIIWAGTLGHGLAKYDTDKDEFTYYANIAGDTNSISSNLIVTISECEEGFLWIGTNGSGFDRFDKKANVFKNYNARNGLINEMVSSIVPDYNGNLWITTVKGVSRFNKETETFRNYDILDGLQDNAFLQNSSWRDAHGTIYLGGRKGFNVFHPDSIKDNPIQPDVVVTDFRVFNESVEPGSVSYLPSTITTTSELTLSHREYVFSFEFASLHYASSIKNQYKYKMEGFDEDWVTTTYDRRFASYSNLPGGEYVFRVLGSNNDGVWNETGTSIKITVTPPYYKTTWFFVLVGLLTLLAIYILFRLRERAAKEKERTLQKRIDESIAKVEKQKEELIQQHAELQLKQEEDRKRQWFNEGVALFADIMRKHKNDINALANNILNNLVRYVKASQGGLFVLNDDDDKDKFLQLVSSYGYSNQLFNRKRIEIGEGIIGNCFIEKKTKRISDLPSDYIVSSGLGKSKPAQLIVVPLLLDDLIFGVLEIASFEAITDLHVNFIEKLAENITAQLFNTKISVKTARLLAQSQKQAEELRLQEEEARRNIEELQANREEALRQKSEALGYLNSMNHSIIRADFDLSGYFTYGNTKFLDYFKYKTKEASSMHVTQFFLEQDRALFQEKWKDLLNGSPHIEEIFNHRTKDGEVRLLSTFTVVRNIEGEMQKVLYLGLDFSESFHTSCNFSDEEVYVLNSFVQKAELDRNGVVQSANNNFLTAYSFGSQELINLNIKMFMHEKDQDEFKKTWEKILDGQQYEEEVYRISNENEKRWFAVTFIPVRNNKGIVDKVSYISLDITDRKLNELKAEEQMQQAVSREKELKKQLAEALKKLKNLNS